MIRRLIALIVIISLSSCGWKITPPAGQSISAISRPIADSLVLEVNDGAVIWGHGELGETVKQTFLEKGAFKQVYYPVIPRTPPIQRLRIQASGDIEEEVGVGVIKSIIIGALFFIPVGIIRFNRFFVLDANVSYLENGKAMRNFKVHSETEVSHTMFSNANQYDPAARKAAFTHLGESIIRELSAK